MDINGKITVLVVEDSLVFREFLVNSINKDPKLSVIAVAKNPFEARDAILQHHPDVMTLDVELPGMNGIDFLRRLLPQYSIPVVMVSSLNATVFDALEAGAVDFVNKPSRLTPDKIDEFVRTELNQKIKIASVAKVKDKSYKAPVKPKQAIPASNNLSDKILAIGASTGGTEAIFAILKKLDTDVPGVVVTQHMPPGFTAMYAERLNRQCKLSVKEAANGDIVMPGCVYIAPGDQQMRLVKSGTVYKLECRHGEKVSGHCPSVDVLFDSVAKSAGRKAIGVILTGMGADGADGLLAMKNAGAETIGQNEASCIVYGMPKVAYDKGAVKYQLPLDRISDKIYSILRSL